MRVTEGTHYDSAFQAVVMKVIKATIKMETKLYTRQQIAVAKNI
jgi:hypothetical protein